MRACRSLALVVVLVVLPMTQWSDRTSCGCGGVATDSLELKGMIEEAMGDEYKED